MNFKLLSINHSTALVETREHRLMNITQIPGVNVCVNVDGKYAGLITYDDYGDQDLIILLNHCFKSDLSGLDFRTLPTTYIVSLNSYIKVIEWTDIGIKRNLTKEYENGKK